MNMVIDLLNHLRCGTIIDARRNVYGLVEISLSSTCTHKIVPNYYLRSCSNIVQHEELLNANINAKLAYKPHPPDPSYLRSMLKIGVNFNFVNQLLPRVQMECNN